MEKKIIEKTDELISEILNQGININNLDNLMKLSKIKHMAKEDMEMNYGRYGRGSGYSGYGNYGRGSYGENYGRGSYGENYGEYGNYGARGYDAKYRGFDQVDKMGESYGRYMESRERYGANSEDTKKSLKYMLESMEDFVKMLKQEAGSQEEMSMIRESVQRIANM